MRSPQAAMMCPICNVPLAMSDREGVEIDYCAQCRGVWLDRGELDKIIDRSAAAPPAPLAPPAPPYPGETPVPAGWTTRRDRDDDDDDDDDDRRRSHHEYGRDGRPVKRKKKGLLGDLFDF